MWPEGHWDPERLEGNRAGVLPLSDSATRRPLGGHAHTLQEDPPTSKNIPSIFLPGVDPSGPFQGEPQPWGLELQHQLDPRLWPGDTLAPWSLVVPGRLPPRTLWNHPPTPVTCACACSTRGAPRPADLPLRPLTAGI